MKGVELYGRVRYAVQMEGLSHREAARRFGIIARQSGRGARDNLDENLVSRRD